jgi:hypothetical protein
VLVGRGSRMVGARIAHGAPRLERRKTAGALLRGDDGLLRPEWAAAGPLLQQYYDTEWGMPIRDEQGLFPLGAQQPVVAAHEPVLVGRGSRMVGARIAHGAPRLG